MNFQLRCRCGPRRQIRANLVDATPRPAPRYDPTGTAPISKQFGKDFAQRWQRVRRMIPDAVSLKLTNAATHALITGNDPVRAFQAWLDESMRQFVLGINGTWTMPYVRGAGDLARATSAQTLGDAFNPDQPNVDRVPLLQSLTISELRGIIDATSQQATRAFANGMLANLSSSRTARNVNAVIDSIGRRRSQLLASFMPMRSFSAVTLDAFRAHGVASVGTIAERAGVATAPSPTILARDAKAKKKIYKPKNLIEILTAGDSKVCEDCEQISEEGPYTIDEAENLIPAHINCRCLFVPWHDDRFADPDDIEDEFKEEDHPRDDKGMFTFAGTQVNPGGDKIQTNVEAKSLATHFSNKGIDLDHYTPEETGNGFHEFVVPKRQAFDVSEGLKSMGYEHHVIQGTADYAKFKIPSEAHTQTVATTPSASPAASIAEKHAAMQKEIDEKDLHMKFEGSTGGTEGPVFFTEKQHEAAMHAMAAKHGMQLTKIIEGESVSTWKPEHAPPPASAIKQGPEQLDVAMLTKTGGKKGSNKGGTYKDEATGESYYIKNPPTKDHVQNETMAAKLYQLAGARTMDYVPVKGGEHVATILKPLDKDNISKFSAAEKAEAQKDFGIHAWLANWDAAGTGGDNQVVIGGHTHTVDVGGSMKYRAQGTAKGEDYGSKVTETLSMLDSSKSPDAAKLYGSMTTLDKIESYKRVTSIPDQAISKTVHDAGGNHEDAQKLIDRKHDLASQTAVLEKSMGITPLVAAPAPVSGVTEHNIEMLAATAKAAQAAHEAQVVPTAPVPAFKTKMEHVAHLLNKGTTNEEIKGKLNWPTISVPQVAHNLNLNLEKVKVDGVIHYKATPMTPAEIAAKGDKPAKATKPLEATPEQAAFFKAAMKGEAAPVPITTMKMGPSVVKEVGSPIAKPTYGKEFDEALAKEEAVKVTPELALMQVLEENGVKAEISTGTLGHEPGHFISLKSHEGSEIVTNIMKYNPAAKKVSTKKYFVPDKTLPSMAELQAAVAAPTPPKAVPPPPPPPTPPPTADELKKAQKNTKLTAQYVPGAPANHPEAEKLIEAFNQKYEGKVISDPQELAQKVAAFKQLTANMVPLQSAQQLQASQAKAAQLTKVAEAKAAEAKAAAATEANLPNLPEEEQREYWLKKISSDYASDFLSKGKSDVAKHAFLKSAGSTPAEVGFVRAFTGSYSSVNENMRLGHMHEKEFAFKHIMLEALDKMPKFTGDVVYRKITLSSDDQSKYVPGQIAHWKAFNSSSTNPNTWSGNTHFVIRNPKTGVDVKKISEHPSEAEVIMPADTYYRVISVKPNTDVNGSPSKNATRIEMEEVIPFGKKKKV